MGLKAVLKKVFGIGATAIDIAAEVGVPHAKPMDDVIDLIKAKRGIEAALVILKGTVKNKKKALAFKRDLLQLRDAINEVFPEG